jgi:hypothetical protein
MAKSVRLELESGGQMKNKDLLRLIKYFQKSGH